jgi:hypothetical protein
MWDVWKSALMIFSVSSFNVLLIPEGQKYGMVEFLSEQQEVSFCDYVEVHY